MTVCHCCGRHGSPAEGMLCRKCGGSAFSADYWSNFVVKPKVDDKAPPVSEPQPVADNGVALYGRWVPAKCEGLAGIKTTIDTSTDKGKAALVHVASPGLIEVGQDGRARFVVRDVAIFWDQGVDEETGELSEFIRTVFYDSHERTFRTTSPHAPHFVARLIDVFGMDRFREGIPVTVCERKSRKTGRTYHDFRVETGEA